MKIDFKLLDGIRGIAALYVVINHSRGHLYIGGAKLAEIVPVSEWTLIDKMYLAVVQSTILGTEFVILFFILSGFSIAHSLSHKSSALSFFQRRFVRVYPVYILGFVWSLLIFWLLKYSVPTWFLKADNIQANAILHYNSSFDTPQNILFTLLYIPSGSLIAQYWSLSHEIIFYLFAPLLIASKRIYYAVSLMLYFSSWSWFGVNDASENIIINFLFNYNIFFAVGLIIYDWRDEITQLIPSKKKVYSLLSLPFPTYDCF